jgi:membrane protein YdbS with pleckstrin-like domain
MASTSINIGEFGSDPVGSEKALLTARPDIRFLKLSFLAPAVVLVAGIVVYLLPLAIDRDFQLAGSAFLIGIGLVGMACLLALYEGLSKAEYRLTNGHIEEEYGVINRRVRRIPLSYVRDVTYDQNFLQAIFGVSSITISPTNCDKIVLSNVRDGEQARETIWKLVLSKSAIGHSDHGR